MIINKNTKTSLINKEIDRLVSLGQLAQAKEICNKALAQATLSNEECKNLSERQVSLQVKIEEQTPRTNSTPRALSNESHSPILKRTVESQLPSLFEHQAWKDYQSSYHTGKLQKAIDIASHMEELTQTNINNLKKSGKAISEEMNARLFSWMYLKKHMNLLKNCYELAQSNRFKETIEQLKNQLLYIKLIKSQYTNIEHGQMVKEEITQLQQFIELTGFRKNQTLELRKEYLDAQAICPLDPNYPTLGEFLKLIDLDEEADFHSSVSCRLAKIDSLAIKRLLSTIGTSLIASYSAVIPLFYCDNSPELPWAVMFLIFLPMLMISILSVLINYQADNAAALQDFKLIAQKLEQNSN